MGKSAYHASLRMWVQTPRTNIKARYTAQWCHSHAPIWSAEDETGDSQKARGLVSLLFLHGKKTRILSQIRKKSGIDKSCLSSNVHTHTHICLREREERKRERRKRHREEREKREMERGETVRRERERKREIMSNILDAIVPGKQTLHLSLSF